MAVAASIGIKGDASEKYCKPLILNEAITVENLRLIEMLVKGKPRTENDQIQPGQLYRYAQAVWIERDAVSAPLYLELEENFRIANEQYRMGIGEIEEDLFYLEYPAGGHLDWHTDHWPEISKRRKISCSIMLSQSTDYKGGKLEVCPGGEIQDFVGTACGVYFPSYLAHRITPITEGLRRVLVAWIHGEPLC
jgi:PKHD-type hydroxylase